MLSVIFSHLLDPEELCTVPCVCKHWKFVAEDEKEAERNWRAAAEELGLGLDEREANSYSRGRVARAALAAERRVVAAVADSDSRDLVDLLLEGPRARGVAGALLRVPAAGHGAAKAKSTQQAAAAGSKLKRGAAATLLPSPTRGPALLLLRLVFRAARPGEDKRRLVDEEAALRILRRGRDAQASSSCSGSNSSGSSGGGGNEIESDEGEGEPNEEKDDELELQRLQGLLRWLPRTLDSHPQDPNFRTVELFRRRDVRAIARGFWNDIVFEMTERKYFVKKNCKEKKRKTKTKPKS